MTAAAFLTLADLDDDLSLEPLDALLERMRPAACRYIEFVDDNHKRGYRALEYKVSCEVGHEWDESGCSPVVESTVVSVRVWPSLDIDIIARLLTSEIEAFICS